jgi:predicted RND superfamily exporter protein
MTDFIIKYRWLIISVCIAAGLSFGLLIPFSKTDPEIRNYVPEKMSSRIETNKIEEEFGVQDMVMILFNDSAILTPENLQQIKDIDRGVSRLSGVSNRISLFTVKNIKSSDGMLIADPLLKRVPADTTGIRSLKEDIIKSRFARDIVISSDFKSAAITATINNSVPETETLSEIDSVIAAHPGKAQILTGGLPYLRHHIMKDVRKDAIVLVPASLLIMLLILKLSLGSWKSVFMPFTVVILSTAICMGMIPLLGWKLSIISLLVPVILVGVANNYGIYLAARYQEIRKARGSVPKAEIIREILGSLKMPILFSGLTTIAGILGLLAHSIIPAKQVGVLAATGVTSALVMSLLFIPALIYVRDESPIRQSTERKISGILQRGLDMLTEMIIRRPGRIIVVFTILTFILSAGVILLKIETNQENLFPKKSQVRMASGIINEKFGGSQTVSVMISGDIKDPAIMNGIDRITSELESEEGVGAVFSISLAVREMSKAIYTPGEDSYDKIPQSREAIAQMFELYNMSGDQSDFKQLMNLEDTKAHILIRLSSPESRVITNVEAKIDELTKNFPASVTVGGYALIMNDFASSVIRGQVSSLLFAMVTVFILLAIVFKSVKGGIIGSLPFTASVVVLFGFMGFAGIALDSATALISSIMIGVGVDFTIQYIWCFNIEIRKGLSYEEATRSSMRTIGRSIIINALSVMAGFSALMLSGFTSIRFFGYLVFISIGLCLIGALVLIPAILVRFRPRFAEKDMSYGRQKTKVKRQKKYEKESIDIGVTSAAFAGISSAARSRRDNEQEP